MPTVSAISVVVFLLAAITFGALIIFFRKRPSFKPTLAARRKEREADILEEHQKDREDD